MLLQLSQGHHAQQAVFAHDRCGITLFVERPGRILHRATGGKDVFGGSQCGPDDRHLLSVPCSRGQVNAILVLKSLIDRALRRSICMACWPTFRSGSATRLSSARFLPALLNARSPWPWQLPPHVPVFSFQFNDFQGLTGCLKKWGKCRRSGNDVRPFRGSSNGVRIQRAHVSRAAAISHGSDANF